MNTTSKTPPQQRPTNIPDHAEKVFEGTIFTVYQWEQELFDGTTATFERITRPDTVTVLPVLPNGEIIVCNQEQPAKPPFTGVIGGVVDPGEDPFEAAKRELLEETGYATPDEHWHHWYSLSYDGKIVWDNHFYIAHQCQKVANQNLDGGEKIDLFTVSFDQLLETSLQPQWRDIQLTMKLLQVHHYPQKWENLRQLLTPPDTKSV